MKPRLALAFFCLFLIVLPGFAGEIKRHEMNNGLEVLMKEAHGGPMVASIVTVGAGSRWEDADSYGASHFLEHMVFNGTALRTREDINEGIKKYGGYINAFTRREYTCYILLIPKEYLREGLEIQADMLYGSLLPPEEFEKERLVVIEEIRKDMDSGSYRSAAMRDGILLEGSPYAHPVLGTPESIESLERDKVIDYYQKQYVPSNSRLFLVGDFETRKAKRLLKEVFGNAGGEKPQAPAEVKLAWPAVSDFHSLQVEGQRPSLSLIWQVPPITAGEYPAQLLLAALLSDEHRSPLSGLNPGVHVELFEDFSLLHMNLDPEDRDPGEVLEELSSQLAALADWEPDPVLVSEAAHGLVVDDAFLQDTYHYFAMMKSAELHMGGFEFLRDYLANLRSMGPVAVRNALEKSLLASAPRILFESSEETALDISEDLLVRFQPTFRHLELAESKASKRKSLSRRKRSRSVQTRKRTLDNGLRVLLISDPGSEVFASHLLVRGRSLREPKAGMVDLMQSLLDAGSSRSSGEEIAARLSAMGAKLKTGDNPWFPFDNYYSREDFSFIRLETLDESADGALELLSELIREATFPQDAFEREIGKRMGTLQMKSPSPSSRASRLLTKSIFPDCGRGKALSGTVESISSIVPTELREFYREYYDPSQMILSVVSGLPMKDLEKQVKRHFAALPFRGGPLKACSPKPGPQRLESPMEKEQVAILLSRLLPPLAELDPAFPALVSILSARMALELREKQGLAYSVGAGMRSVPGLAPGEKGFTRLSLSISTGSHNREQALEGMRAELRGMVENPPSEEEIFRAVNGKWGRELMRNLSRIHQAYRMGLAEHLGNDPFAAPGGDLQAQRESGPDHLATLARQTLLSDDWMEVLAGGGLN
ncbi:MAG: pitrilysin family protein [Candidatus Krumholzibacteria bacterium]|nr:pitrilysin family protein [Candidatus Krumholzibacteria bacterium]MDP6797101.1 pitrilysin family protein [Candidatus Krumholzibacteria bacterium]MDP7022446.1 pitrilysin family protein [Candidatus Krumholzibacteria bacterium]